MKSFEIYFRVARDNGQVSLILLFIMANDMCQLNLPILKLQLWNLHKLQLYFDKQQNLQKLLI